MACCLVDSSATVQVTWLSEKEERCYSDHHHVVVLLSLGQIRSRDPRSHGSAGISGGPVGLLRFFEDGPLSVSPRWPTFCLLSFHGLITQRKSPLVEQSAGAVLCPLAL